MADDDVEVWDFALEDKPKRFRFNGDEVYEAPAVLPPATLRKMASMRGAFNAENVDPGTRFDQLRDLFAEILVPESAKRFRERFDSTDDPIDLQRQLIPCLHRLMEAYGLRPTQPSSPSSNGGDATATPSTAGPPRAALNPKRSRPTAGLISSTTGS